MKAEEYQKIYAWFQENPIALWCFRRLYTGCTSLVIVAYLLLFSLKAQTCFFGIALMQMIDSVESATKYKADLLAILVVPAAVFLLGTVVRAIINAPRPYEQEGFTPLIYKNRSGHSCPSRHVLSVMVIAVVWWLTRPSISICLLLLAVVIAALRVLAGVHSVRDVVAGLLFGGIGGILGLVLFYVAFYMVY
ncbi:MAG: phosphatase PAP2 family protein [Faecalibacterium sp.]